MKIRGTDYVFYNVTDIKRATEFYKGILGLKQIGKASDSWAEFETGNMALGIGIFGHILNKGQKSPVSIALSVDDVKKAVEELEKKGVKIAMELNDFPGCSMAIIADPDGNEIILHHRKDGTVG